MAKQISQAAQNALMACRAEENIVYLPGEQLDRNVYVEVKKILESHGGKWKGGKVQGFVFPTPSGAESAMEVIHGGDMSNRKKEFQFFATPQWVANMMAEDLYRPLASPSAKVLEPSAGDGALVKAIHMVNPEVVVDCYELMPEHRETLSKMENVNVLGEDFLQAEEGEQYDAIIANPPFAKNQDIKHVRKMFAMLRKGGEMAFISSTHWTFANDKESVEFRKWMNELGAHAKELPAATFKESGTNVPTMYCKITK